MESEQIPIIYKYTSKKSAGLIITKRSLRMGRPTEMNDPFDVYIDDLFDTPLRQRYRAAATILVEMIERDPAAFADRISVPIEEVAAVSAMMNAGTAAQRDELLALLASLTLEEVDPRLAAECDALEIQRSALISQFRNSGIFCATRRNDNLLMWAHYADEHRGVVLGFRPDAALDSFLCLLEPVTYSAIRPTFYDPVDPLMGVRPGPEDMRAFNRSLTTAKSPEWAYEEELRLVIPSHIPDGQAEVFMPFYPHELAELYLGYRFDRACRNEIVATARALNKDVSIFEAKLARGALSFERIA